LEVEKVKAQSKLDLEKKERKEGPTKLPASTPAENWTANMPSHHLEGYSQTEAQVEESEDEDSSDDESSDDE